MSVILRLPLRDPEAVGVKVTLITHLALEAKAAGQLLTCAKSPVVWSVPMFNVKLPVFVKVTDCVALEVPICWPVKTKLVGLTVAVARGAAEPVPVRFTS